MRHPFKPQIFKESKNMIIGTLPPDRAKFYYSNSTNNRMWDILRAIENKRDELPKNSYRLPTDEKIKILKTLNLSMCDVILEYERKNRSVKDEDIIPLKYNDIADLIKGTSISNLLFVYQSALRWFLHSLKTKTPLELKRVPKLQNREYGEVDCVILNGRKTRCILLPNPLSRGKKGETLKKKVDIYKEWIVNY